MGDEVVREKLVTF